MNRVCLVFVLLTSVFPALSSATTWHVEKDGGGDFSVIQDAVDAAASGDTVLVGPGWFEEYRMYSVPNGEYALYVQKTVRDLTIIGAGSAMTIIGPSEEDTWGNSDKCIGIVSGLSFSEPGRLRVENVSVVRVPRAFEITSGSLSISECAVSDCYDGIASKCLTQVFNCEFFNCHWGVLIFSGAYDVIFEGCLFEDCSTGFNCSSTPGISVRNCQLQSCGQAGLFNGCTGEMLGCSVTDAWFAGVAFYGSGVFHFYDNQVNSAHYNMIFGQNADNLLCENNIFSGTDRECLHITSCQPVFHNNQILKDSGFAVYLGGFAHETEHVDMTKNYWGTDDPDSIAAWISDANDEYSSPMHGYVDFMPFTGGPVPTQKTTSGGLKAMFRDATR